MIQLPFLIDIIREKCTNWFTVEYDAQKEELEKITSQIEQKTRELEESPFMEGICYLLAVRAVNIKLIIGVYCRSKCFTKVN